MRRKQANAPNGEGCAPIVFRQEDGGSLIRLQGAIDIGSAAEFKDLLVQGLKSGAPMRVSLEQATSLDVTAIQLLWAASREATRVGVGFALEGSTSESVRSALLNAGLEKFPVPD